MSDNIDEIGLAAMVEIRSGTIERGTLVEMDTMDCETLVEEETINSCSEPMVTVGDDDSDEDDYDNYPDEDLVEENEEAEEEEENSEDEYEDYGDHYRRRGDYYDDYDFICKKCKADDSYNYVILRPAILTAVPSLTEIASVCVAATLWNHVNVPQKLSFVTEKCTKNSSRWNSLRDEVLSLSHKLPIPNLVAEQINMHVKGMATKITDWVSYHFLMIFQKNGIDKAVYNNIYQIVWHSNGAINCKESARSMITSVGLSEVEKFKFLATYCIREEIEELSPLVFLNNVMEYVSFAEYPLIVYWYRYFKNQLHKIVVNDRELSLDAFMFRHKNVNNWSAKEYFFDRLSRKKQVNEAIWLINKQGSFYQNAVLSKLDEDQRLRVFMRVGVKIITNYIEPPINSNSVLSTWHEIRHFVNAEKCIHIFRRLLKAEVDETLLTEIWVNTPDELKNFLIYANNYEIIEKVLLSWKWANGSDFIFVMLEELHADTKRAITKEPFFQTFFDNLLWNGGHERINRILQCCLPELEEMAEFKRDISVKSSFTTQCDYYFRCGNYHKLNAVLEFCFPELEENLRFKANFIKTSNCMSSCEHLLKTGCNDRLNALLEYFLLNIEERVRFKRELVRRSSCTVYCENLSFHGEYQKLNKVLEFCLPEVDEKRQFKADFIKTSNCMSRCEHLLTTGCYDRLNALLEYFLPNIEERVRFKRELFRRSSCTVHCENLSLHGEYQKLNQVLEFCLPEVEEKRQFKADFIKNHGENLLTTSNYDNLSRMLKFFLLDNEDEVRLKRELLEKPSCINHCEKLISHGETQKLTRLLAICLPKLEDRSRFKLNVAKMFCKNRCGKSLSQNEYQRMDRVLEFCLPEVEERVRFMKDMTDKTVFEKYCEMLLPKMDYEKLNLSLKTYCSSDEEMKQFKQNLVLKSIHVRNTCLIYYSSGNTIQLNNYLMQVLAPYPDLISTYKNNLLNSPGTIRKCIDLFTSQTDVVSLIIEDTLKDSNQAMEFKKSLIMSQYAISKLKKLLTDNGLNVVKSCYDRYLMLSEDKNNFKKLLVGDVVKQIRTILQNNNETYLQSFMLWYFGSEDAVQKFKKTMALGLIFIDLLKDSTFLQYDRLLPNCRFRSSFDPKVVDRFLDWYFESPHDRMQFKMKVIRNYSKYEMFNTLLRKSDVSYLKAIVQWFFQKDAVEIARFKSGSYHKISKLL